MSIALLFGGQGTQYSGMGKEYYNKFTYCREIFEIASDILGYDISSICFGKRIADINKTIYAQPCILAVELCSYIHYLHLGLKYDCVAGFSLGEIAAMVAARIITIKQSFEIVKIRAMVMEDALEDGNYGMLAVSKLPIKIIEELCQRVTKGEINVSNYNSYNQVVIAGELIGIEILIKLVNNAGGLSIPLKVNKPFHSIYMKSAAEKFKSKIKNMTYSKPQYPIYMNLDGKLLKIGDEIDIISKQIYKPVRWIDTVENMLKDGIDEFYELAPKSVLCRFVKDIVNVNSNIKTTFMKEV